MKKQMFYCLLIMLCFCQCKKEVIDLESQVAYFEINQENYAWGYAYFGEFITKDGEILSYNMPENPWDVGDKKSKISEADLLDNMAQASFSGFYMPTNNFHEAIGKISSLGTKFSKHKSIGADAGKITIWAYCLTKEGTYERILLKECGDFERINKSDAAKEIVEILEENRPYLCGF